MQAADAPGKLEAAFSDSEIKELLRPRVSFAPASLDFAGEKLKLGIMTDTHIGSRYTDDGVVMSAIEEFNAQNCDAILHSGDISEGMSGRDGHVYELTHVGYARQRDACINLLSNLKAPKKYLISGNHDRWYLSKADMGADIVADIAKGIGAEYLGHDEGDISINGVVIRLWHGEDASSYAVSYRVQKIIESFTGGEKPNMLVCGHTHKSLYMMERNVHAISAGCLQSQSRWMRSKRLAAHRGFWIATLTLGDGEIKRIDPSWYPIY